MDDNLSKFNLPKSNYLYYEFFTLYTDRMGSVVVQHDKKEESQCPLSKASLMLSSKWDLIVIHNIENGPIRFSHLKEKISSGLDKPVTASSLSRILKRLEVNKIIKRTVKSQIGESIEISYELTQRGKDLKPVIKNLQEWSQKYLL